VGELPKTEVRRIAAEIGLPNAKKKDSTGICFIGERPFREFLNRYLSQEPGPIKDDAAARVGQHVGLSFYTLGQRQGLGIGGVKDKGARCAAAASTSPGSWPARTSPRNTLWVVQGHDHPWLLSHALKPTTPAGAPASRPPPAPTPPRPATARPTPPAGWAWTSAGGDFRLRFDQPQWAVTPGQSRCCTTARSAWAAAIGGAEAIELT
jgi:tRNA-specific 2-thiouridylase